MKLISILFPAIIIGGLFIVGCRHNNRDSAEAFQNSVAGFDILAAKKNIEEKNRQFTNAHMKGDTAFLINIFTQDAKILPPNAGVVTGRSAIIALNAEFINLGITEFREETLDFYGNANLLIDEGSYYLRYGKDNVVDSGKYMNVWKKEEGDWKIYSNIWNTNLPVPHAVIVN